MTGIFSLFTYLKGFHFCAYVREAMDPDRDILTKPLLKVGSLKVKEKLIKSNPHRYLSLRKIHPWFFLGKFLQTK